MVMRSPFLRACLPPTTHPPVQFKCRGVRFDPKKKSETTRVRVTDGIHKQELPAAGHRMLCRDGPPRSAHLPHLPDRYRLPCHHLGVYRSASVPGSIAEAPSSPRCFVCLFVCVFTVFQWSVVDIALPRMEPTLPEGRQTRSSSCAGKPQMCLAWTCGLVQTPEHHS